MQSGTLSVRSRPLAIVLIAVALGLLAWWRWEARDERAAGAEGARVERGPVELAAAEVTTAERRSLVRRLPVSGNIASMLKTVVKSRVPGEVLEVTVREGESVRSGEVLARIDTRSLEAQVASARAALEKASADLEIARLNHENSIRLFQKKVLAQNELDTRRSLFEAASAGRKLSAAQLRLAEIALEDAVVRALFDAVIARRYQDPGGKVSPDTPLFEVVDLTHMELRAAAPAAEIPAVRPGQIASVRVDGYGNEEFRARLER
ncbi:MAG: efflux RND transporter periplasmic adaptor subunit, partial [Gammaproteobacteria bacterium]